MPFTLFSNFGRPWLKLQRTISEPNKPEEAAEQSAETHKVEGEIDQVSSDVVEVEVSKESETSEVDTITTLEDEAVVEKINALLGLKTAGVEISLEEWETSVEDNEALEISPGEEVEIKALLEEIKDTDTEVFVSTVEVSGTPPEEIMPSSTETTTVISEEEMTTDDLSTRNEGAPVAEIPKATVPQAEASATSSEDKSQKADAENLSVLEAQMVSLVAAFEAPVTDVKMAPEVISNTSATGSSPVDIENVPVSDIVITETAETPSAGLSEEAPVMAELGPEAQEEAEANSIEQTLDSDAGSVESVTSNESEVPTPSVSAMKTQTFTVAPSVDFAEVNRALSKYGIVLRQNDERDDEKVTVRITTQTA